MKTATIFRAFWSVLLAGCMGLLTACSAADDPTRFELDAYAFTAEEQKAIENSSDVLGDYVDFFRVRFAIQGILSWLETGRYVPSGLKDRPYPSTYYCAVYTQETKPSFAKGEGEYVGVLMSLVSDGENEGKLHPVSDWTASAFNNFENMSVLYPYLRDPSLVFARGAYVDSVTVAGLPAGFDIVRYSRKAGDWYLLWLPEQDRLYLLKWEELTGYVKCYLDECQRQGDEFVIVDSVIPVIDADLAHEKAHATVAHRLFTGPIDTMQEDAVWFLEAVLLPTVILTGAAALSGFALAGYRRRSPCKEIEE